MHDKLVIWGAAGHASVVADIVRLEDRFEIVGFLDDEQPQRRGSPFCGSQILGGAEQLAALRREGIENLIVAFGHCRARLAAGERARAAGFKLPSAVHPRAVLAGGLAVGAGTAVMAGVVVNPGATIGENVIVNTNATIEHECIIEAGAHLCPRSVLGGKVRIGRAAWVGIGATVREKIVVGADSIIGAGAVVVADVPDRAVVFGVPAIVQRYLEPHALEKRP
jgi:acetyltransferase EpsM